MSSKVVRVDSRNANLDKYADKMKLPVNAIANTHKNIASYNQADAASTPTIISYSQGINLTEIRGR